MGVEGLRRVYGECRWRGRRVGEWGIVIPVERVCGFVGLRNLGCTCYVNSFVQQLFTIDRFRNGVISASMGQLGPDSLLKTLG